MESGDVHKNSKLLITFVKNNILDITKKQKIAVNRIYVGKPKPRLRVVLKQPDRKKLLDGPLMK